MKKIVILCLALVLLLSAAGVLADDKVTLTFAETMTSPERTLVLQKAIEDFEAANPNIKVELVSPPYESAETKVASMLAAGQEVDIVEIRDNSVGAWINNGFLATLDDLVTGWDGKDQLVDAALLTGSSMGDATYFIPQFLYVKALMVRTDILQKLGVTEMPKTTDEFLAVANRSPIPRKASMPSHCAASVPPARPPISCSRPKFPTFARITST